jgi:ATP-dependent DNA helicase RecG
MLASMPTLRQHRAIMDRLTDNELEALLNDIESDRAERKESWAGDAPEKGPQAICAFANDLPNHQKPGGAFCWRGE